MHNEIFEFIRGEVNESSVKASDSGIGLAVIVIPVENLAFITATKGSVSLTFNNTSLYEYTSLLSGRR